MTVQDTQQRVSVGELSAEFFGTMLLMIIGLGVEAQTITAPDGSLGDHDSVAWAWGLGVVIAVYVAARVSGAHLNPAVSLGLAAAGIFPWRKVVPYAAAQVVGGFVAAIFVRVLYADLINRTDPDTTIATQDIFSTLPGNGVNGVSITTAFFDQVFGTAILLFVICALINTRNAPPLANLEPVVVGLLVVAIGMAWGANAGYAINPARDFGPRVASFLTGYETAFYDQNGVLYFWLPIVAPLIGGVVGTLLFKYAVDQFLPVEEESAMSAKLTVQEATTAAEDMVEASNSDRVQVIKELVEAASVDEQTTLATREAKDRSDAAHAAYVELYQRARRLGWSERELIQVGCYPAFLHAPVVARIPGKG